MPYFILIAIIVIQVFYINMHICMEKRRNYKNKWTITK